MAISSIASRAYVIVVSVAVSVAPANAATLVQRVTASELGVSPYGFGASLAVSGGSALLGAPGGWTQFPDTAGSAVVLESDGTRPWQKASHLYPSTSTIGDGFGGAVDLYGNTALIGARWDKTDGDRVGGAYIFQKDGAGGWSQRARLRPNDFQDVIGFGATVSLFGNYAMVGAPDSSGGAGAAYIFKDNGDGNWGQVAKLNGSDVDGNDLFGYSLSIYGETAVVSAPQWDAPFPRYDAGRAYFFEATLSGEWIEVARLTPQLGGVRNVSLGADTAVIGQPAYGDGNCSGCGAVRVAFKSPTAPWRLAGTFVEGEREERAPRSNFGSAVALDGRKVLVGRPSGLYSEAAYLFGQDEHWVLHLDADKLDPIPNDHINTSFGWAVDMAGNELVIGSNSSVYFYRIVPEPAATVLSAIAFVGSVLLQRRSRRLRRPQVG